MSQLLPLVSIKIASYNHADFIARAIQSVLEQSYQNFEIIIVDDCSQDNSVEVIRGFKDARISLIVNDVNRGAAASSKKAKGFCKGKYFCSLDSDDYFHPEKLERQVTYLETHPSAGLVVTAVQEVDCQGGVLDGSIDWFGKDLDLNNPESWLWENHVCHSSVMVRRHVHDENWDYESGLVYTNDWNNWLRFLAKGITFGVIPEMLTYYRVHPGNITNKNAVRSYWEYAYISSKVFHPFLIASARDDLVTRNVIEFFRHPCCPVDKCERINFSRLLSRGGGISFDNLWLRRSELIDGLELDSFSQVECLIFESLFSWVREVEVILKDMSLVINEKETLIRQTVYPRLVRWIIRKLDAVQFYRKG